MSERTTSGFMALSNILYSVNRKLYQTYTKSVNTGTYKTT